MSDSFEARKIHALVENQWDDYDAEDKVILQNVIKKVRADSYSLRKKSTKIFITFYGVKNISYETMRLIELCSGDIFRVELNLKNKTLRVAKWKHATKPSALALASVIQGAANKAILSALSERWIKKEENIRDEDKRLLQAVVETVVGWTWNKAACKTTLKNTGDDYNFVITNLPRITLEQCEELMKLNNVVSDLKFYIGDKKISFKIRRTIYSTKKRKRED